MIYLKNLPRNHADIYRIHRYLRYRTDHTKIIKFEFSYESYKF